MMLEVIPGQNETFCMSNLGSSDSTHTYLECEPRLLMQNVSLCPGIEIFFTYMDKANQETRIA